MSIDIDIAIFLVFLALNLAVGLYYGRGVKTIKDYALGGRNFSTGALVATIVATWVSGSGFFITVSKTYSDGLYYLIASLCAMAVQPMIIAVFLIPRMKEFFGKASTAEVMGDLYGKEVRLITAVCGIILNIGGIAIQFKVFGNVFNYFLGISATYAIIMAALIVVIYSAFGGIRAVTYTDMMQFITFGVAIPFIGAVIWNHFYDPSLSLSYLIQKTPNFNLSEIINFSNPEFWQMIPLALCFAIPVMESMDFQRISIGRNIKQVKQAFFTSAILLAFIELAIAWIPFLIVNVNPNLQPDQIISYIIGNYTYTGFKGVVIIGIAAIAMSTADSRINSASVLFAYDINKILQIKIHDLTLSKISAFIIGGFATSLALLKADLLSMILMAASFYMPIVTVPLLLAIFGFRSTTKSVLIGMGAGFLTVIIWNILDIQIDCIVFAMLTNLIFFMGSHYLLKQQGGWIKTSNSNSSDTFKFIRQNHFAQ